MNKLGTSLIYNKKFFQKILFMTLIGLILGFILFKKLDNTTLLNELKDFKTILSNNHINYILMHFITISILIMTSIIGLGLVIIPLYFIWEITCISYSILTFSKIYHFKGLIYGLLYNLITKGFYLILIVIILKKVFNLMKIILTKSSKAELNISLKNNLKMIGICLILIIISDIIVYFLGSNILLKLSFILK